MKIKEIKRKMFTMCVKLYLSTTYFIASLLSAVMKPFYKKPLYKVPFYKSTVKDKGSGGGNLKVENTDIRGIVEKQEVLLFPKLTLPSVELTLVKPMNKECIPSKETRMKLRNKRKTTKRKATKSKVTKRKRVNRSK